MEQLHRPTAWFHAALGDSATPTFTAMRLLPTTASRIHSLLLVALLTAPASAVHISFSLSDTDPYAWEELNVEPGTMVEAYVWIDPGEGQTINGASFDIVSSTPGSVRAVDFEVYNPEVYGQRRWQGNVVHGLLNLDDTRIVADSLGVAVSSPGINSNLSGFGVDPLEVDGQFLHAAFTFEYLGGHAEITAAVPTKWVDNNGRRRGLNPLTLRGLSTPAALTSGSLIATGSPLPEPPPAPPVAPPPPTPIVPPPAPLPVVPPPAPAPLPPVAPPAPAPVPTTPAFEAPRISFSLSSDDPHAWEPINAQPGDIVEAYVWINPGEGQKINGAAFDIVSDTPGAVRALSFETLNPEVLGEPRWQGTRNPDYLEFNASDTSLVAGTLGVAVSSPGINDDLTGLGIDPLEVDGEFLHGVFTFEYLGGDVEISAAPDDRNPLTLSGSSETELTSDFLFATGAPLPEPPAPPAPEPEPAPEPATIDPPVAPEPVAPEPAPPLEPAPQQPEPEPELPVPPPAPEPVPEPAPAPEPTPIDPPAVPEPVAPLTPEPPAKPEPTEPEPEAEPEPESPDEPEAPVAPVAPVAPEGTFEFPIIDLRVLPFEPIEGDYICDCFFSTDWWNTAYVIEEDGFVFDDLALDAGEMEILATGADLPAIFNNGVVSRRGAGYSNLALWQPVGSLNPEPASGALLLLTTLAPCFLRRRV